MKSSFILPLFDEGHKTYVKCEGRVHPLQEHYYNNFQQNFCMSFKIMFVLNRVLR